MTKLRVQLDFTQAAVKELDELKHLMGASSRAEVIRHALRWMYWTVRQLNAGSRLLMDEAGEQKEVVLPFVTVTKLPLSEGLAIREFESKEHGAGKTLEYLKTLNR